LLTAPQDFLVDHIETPGLLRHTQALEDIAYATPGRNRVVGSKGHNKTIEYILATLQDPRLNGYYDVFVQDFQVSVQESGNASLTTTTESGAIKWTPIVAEFSPNGTFTLPLVLVDNLGCNAVRFPINYHRRSIKPTQTDFPAAVSSSIALISRGVCKFAHKSALAGAAGARGAIIYNNVAGNFAVSLGLSQPEQGPVIPTIGITLANGTALAEQLKAGARVSAAFDVATLISRTMTTNILAQTACGDEDNVIMLGAHTDSVKAGPGINDNGSGTAALLEIALQLSRFRVRNAVRWAFWSAEEQGLIGSENYVASLNKSDIAKIRAYLNFDMLASPNYRYATFDGAQKYFNTSGVPPGSGALDALFREWFEGEGLNITAAEFTGRSDYASFFDSEIPTGGLATGSNGNKTKEEVEMFGGQEGVWYDPNYHGAGDNMTNLAVEALTNNAKSIGYVVGTLGRSLERLEQDKVKVESSRGKYRIKTKKPVRELDIDMHRRVEI